MSKAICDGATIQVLQTTGTPIMINDHPHAGSASHKCSLDKGHGGDHCKCMCGYEWLINEKRLVS